MISTEMLENALQRAADTKAVDLSNCGICFLSNLASLSARRFALRRLDLSGNRISVLANLPPIVTLEVFDVSCNALREVVAALPFPRLKVFAAHDNAITRVTSQFPAGIEVIDLQNNHIATRADVSACSGAKMLNLAGNPAESGNPARDARYRDIIDVDAGFGEYSPQNEAKRFQAAESTFYPTYASNARESAFGESPALMCTIYPRKQQSMQARQPYNAQANRAYEELLALYEKQLAYRSGAAFPDPTGRPDLHVLRRALFQHIYDNQRMQREIKTLYNKFDAQESAAALLQQRMQLLQNQTAEREQDIAQLNQENTELHIEMEAYFGAAERMRAVYTALKASIGQFAYDACDGCAELEQDALEAVTVLHKRVQRCQERVRSFKVEPKRREDQTTQCDRQFVGRAAGSQTEDAELASRFAQTDWAAVAACDSSVQTEALAEISAVQPIELPAEPQPRCLVQQQEAVLYYQLQQQYRDNALQQYYYPTQQFAYCAQRLQPQAQQFKRFERQILEKQPLYYRYIADNAPSEFPTRQDNYNLLLMSPGQFSYFVYSTALSHHDLHASDLGATSVTQIARKYQAPEMRVPALNYQSNAAQAQHDRNYQYMQYCSYEQQPLQLRFFGVRPQSFVSYQLAALDLE